MIVAPSPTGLAPIVVQELRNPSHWVGFGSGVAATHTVFRDFFFRGRDTKTDVPVYRDASIGGPGFDFFTLLPLDVSIATGDNVTSLSDNPTEPSKLRVTWEDEFGPFSDLTLLMLDSSHSPVSAPISRMVPLPAGLRIRGGAPLALNQANQYLIRWIRPNHPVAPTGEELDRPLCLRLVAPPFEGQNPGIIFLPLFVDRQITVITLSDHMIPLLAAMMYKTTGVWPEIASWNHLTTLEFGDAVNRFVQGLDRAEDLFEVGPVPMNSRKYILYYDEPTASRYASSEFAISWNRQAYNGGGRRFIRHSRAANVGYTYLPSLAWPRLFGRAWSGRSFVRSRVRDARSRDLTTYNQSARVGFDHSSTNDSYSVVEDDSLPPPEAFTVYETGWMPFSPQYVQDPAIE